MVSITPTVNNENNEYDSEKSHTITWKVDEKPVVDSLYVNVNDDYTWRQLRKVYSLGNLNWKSFNNMFANAKKLNKIPNEELLQTKIKYDYNGNMYNGYLVYNTSYMFYNCYSISNFPKDFKLNENFIDMSYMFYNCFSNKQIHESFRQSIIPANRIYI
jgi:hypothetical protein